MSEAALENLSAAYGNVGMDKLLKLSGGADDEK